MGDTPAAILDAVRELDAKLNERSWLNFRDSDNDDHLIHYERHVQDRQRAVGHVQREIDALRARLAAEQQRLLSELDRSAADTSALRAQVTEQYDLRCSEQYSRLLLQLHAAQQRAAAVTHHMTVHELQRAKNVLLERLCGLQD